MIRRTTLALTFAVTAAIGSAGDRSAPDGPPAESAAPAEPRTLGVEEFMKAVDRHRGEVRVEGVVSVASTEKKTFALIDLKEFEHCGVVTCAPLTLPVRWTGAMPSARDRVRVEGKVEEIDGKLVFVAKRVEKAKQEPEQKK